MLSMDRLILRYSTKLNSVRQTKLVHTSGDELPVCTTFD